MFRTKYELHDMKCAMGCAYEWKPQQESWSLLLLENNYIEDSDSQQLIPFHGDAEGKLIFDENGSDRHGNTDNNAETNE